MGGGGVEATPGRYAFLLSQKDLSATFFIFIFSLKSCMYYVLANVSVRQKLDKISDQMRPGSALYLENLQRYSI